MSGMAKVFVSIAWMALMPAMQASAAEEHAAKVENPAPQPVASDAVVDPDDALAAENADAAKAAVAKPVSPELVRVYGWREDI